MKLNPISVRFNIILLYNKKFPTYILYKNKIIVVKIKVLIIDIKILTNNDQFPLNFQYKFSL